MKINICPNINKTKLIKVTSKENPFKETSLEYHLIEFMRTTFKTESAVKDTKELDKKLLSYLSQQNTVFYIDKYNAYDLLNNALNLCVLHNIIQISSVKKQNSPIFGVFNEDGLFDVAKIPSYTNKLPVGKMSSNMELLWLSIYMNSSLRQNQEIPCLTYTRNYDQYKIEFTHVNNSFDMLPQMSIPTSAFSNCWHSDEWLGLQSRGLFHHIGDHVAFWYGASSYGECYFIGLNQYAYYVTLSNSSSFGKKLLWQFHKYEAVHPNDFTYVYGVPKGEVSLSDTAMVFSSETADCQINTDENCRKSERYWENPVFLKHVGRSFYQGSLEDKFIEILKLWKKELPHCNKELDDLIHNKRITKEKASFLGKQMLNVVPSEEIKRVSSFFIKSLAYKTICDVINPPKNQNFGFFLKNNGEKPVVQKFDIGQTLCQLSENSLISWNLEKPLTLIKKELEKKYEKNTPLLNLWDSDEAKGFIFSELVNMKNEYRMFIVNNRVVATSACFRNTVPLNAWQNGRYDPRMVNGHNDQVTHINRSRAYEYARFARVFCQDMKKMNPGCENYVLDVAWDDEHKRVIPIEMNSITWSGAYQINMHRLCAALSHQKFDYQDLNNMMSEKIHHWFVLIHKKIILPHLFDLCGLERTLQGGTQPDLFNQINQLKTDLDKVKIFEAQKSTEIQEKNDFLILEDLLKGMEGFLDDDNSPTNIC